MRKYIPIGLLVGLLGMIFWSSVPPPQSASGQQVNIGAPTVIATNQVLTNSYVFSTAVNLQSYDSICIQAIPGNPLPGTNQVAKLKYQWSEDNSTWTDESVLTAGSASGSEQPYTISSKVIQITLISPTTTTTFVDRARRLGKWFRVAVGSTNASTTATLSVQILQQNNQN